MILKMANRGRIEMASISGKDKVKAADSKSPPKSPLILIEF
jgi:hypothetical protein